MVRSGLAAPLRVLIVARRPVERAGLRGLLDGVSGVSIVGVARSVEEAAQTRQSAEMDVVLAAWDEGGVEASLALTESLARDGKPLVLLGDAPAPTDLARLVRAGLRGFLLGDSGAEEACAAIAAVARGLLVVDPLLARAVPGLAGSTSLAAIPMDSALTERESEVLQLLALGLPNKAIARRLDVSEHTVKFHVGSILAKLDAGSRTEAVTRAARRGLLVL